MCVLLFCVFVALCLNMSLFVVSVLFFVVSCFAVVIECLRFLFASVACDRCYVVLRVLVVVCVFVCLCL